MTHQVLISLASNWKQKKNLSEARLCLGEILFQPHFTEELWTAPIGCASRPDKYLNQLVLATTTLEKSELNQHLKQIEIAMGRDTEKRRSGIVPIDLDLLLFDEERHHLKDWSSPYFKELISQTSFRA
jgi:2-amino-4-hydroxy-6-hydroxymethyldihydropteridine diphosphokinase